MTHDMLRGHPIICINGECLYKDTMTPTVGNERACGHCGMDNTPDGHDGCLGTIPDAMNACCGHGDTKTAYIQYWDGSRIHGKTVFQNIDGRE